MQIKNFEEVTDKLKDFLPVYLEEKGINTEGKFNCLHPDHVDSTPSANLIGDDRRAYCHGCGRYFDIFDAVHFLDNKPRTGLAWIENTLKWLANKYNVEMIMSEMTEEDAYKLDVHRAYQTACDIVSRALTGKVSEEVEAFLDQRGWRQAALGLGEWGVGTVGSFNAFQDEMEDQGFTREFLSEIKLLDPRIFNEKSLVFTWKDEAGRAVGFSARNTIWKKGDLTGKFINTSTSGLKYNLFNKGGRLYGIEEALSAGGPTYIFEGQGDVTTARVAGLMNCVAISGTSFRDDHISLLKYLGLTDVILVLDGDAAGQKKTEEIIESKFAGHRDLKVRVVTLPVGHDPDSYITKYGLDDFQELACWTAFEWRLNRYSPEEDEEKICEQMIPVIASEPSAIAREKMIKTLSDRTSVSFHSINAELNNILDQKSLRRATNRMSVLQKIQFEMMKNPEEAEMILHEGLTDLMEVSRQHSVDVLGEDDFIKDIDEQKANEESVLNSSKWFKLGPDLKDMEETLRGEWIGTWFCFGGKANHGKTALMAKLGMELAKHNDDVVVIYHSIDDTTEQIIPRLVCLADGSKTITMNMVHQPTYWANTKGYSDLPMKRNEAYKVVRQNARDAKLIVKDISKGASLPFAEALIAYYQDKYPDKHVIYMLDNFHKLTDYAHITDERVRMKALSTSVKAIALRRKCCMMSTVEYTKLPPGMKPNNNNIIETGQIEYDANVIFHVYSERADTPDRFTVCHNATNWDGNPAMLPRIEMIVGKNKVTDLKDSFFLDFWPAMSDYSSVSIETVVTERKKMEDWRKGAGNEGPTSEIDEVFSC